MSSAPAFAPSEAFAIPEELADECTLPCRTGDPDLWFAESPSMLQQAKQLCAGCPVREACLAGAIERQEPWGVWGGEIFDRGVVVSRKRGRGRPPKSSSPARQGTAA
ncbi:WhiB family transcriptional regulator [Haloechinothrix sp. YIM 98757]|uniref:Transcriptional regulator WhiB n=1 Tax=Haloechinothrix aidingensis TaxID=2752311 RepID=A0A838ACS0_9PSEU|nr:WhiB family transcriptional regulator [Haloechinothrix aidingensis]MBA0127069.1 WhiB family transcriptional regulator [Haloechinothrix aidingensis]